MKIPSSPLVAILWLQTLGLPADDIGDTLPADPTSWAANGYVQVPTTAGGTPHIDLPIRQPFVQVDCWTNRPNSELAPWNRAESLAGQIVDATQSQTRPVDLTVPSGFRPVRLHSVWAASEPRRLLGDPNRYAHVSVDMEMRWVLL